MTTRLNKDGYVASYNVAYDMDIYDKLGYDEYPYEYETDPRARILSEYHPKMQTIEDMKYWLIMNE
jgi:hypothetical protein